jgi:hypothetical protein
MKLIKVALPKKCGATFYWAGSSLMSGYEFGHQVINRGDTTPTPTPPAKIMSFPEVRIKGEGFLTSKKGRVGKERGT